MIKVSNITAGDIAGAYSVVKVFKFRLTKVTPAIIIPVFLKSKGIVNNLFPNGGRIIKETREYDWEIPYQKLITEIEMEKNKMKNKQYKSSKEQKSTDNVERVKSIMNRIKRHVRIALLYVKFLFTVQHKDGTSLGTDLITIACIAFAITSLTPSSLNYLVGSVIIELMWLLILIAVLEPIYVLFKANKFKSQPQ